MSVHVHAELRFQPPQLVVESHATPTPLEPTYVQRCLPLNSEQTPTRFVRCVQPLMFTAANEPMPRPRLNGHLPHDGVEGAGVGALVHRLLTLKFTAFQWSSLSS